jgi:hypothetical protein
MRAGFELAVIFSGLVAAGCSTGRVDERVAYWSKITSDKVPSGSTLENAQILRLTDYSSAAASPGLTTSSRISPRKITSADSFLRNTALS